MVGDKTIQTQERETACEVLVNDEVIRFTISDLTTEKETRYNFIKSNISGVISSDNKAIFDYPISILKEFFGGNLSNAEYEVRNKRIKYANDSYKYLYDFEVLHYEHF